MDGGALRAMSIPDNPRQFDDDGEAWRFVAVFETTEVEFEDCLTPAFVGVFLSVREKRPFQRPGDGC
jgi:hypothetical protein